MKKSILETIHSSVEELHEIDLVDEVTMREFDAMCLPPIKEYSAIEIRRIRKRNNVSQTVFAGLTIHPIQPLAGQIFNPTR